MESNARIESLRERVNDAIRSLFDRKEPESLYGPMAYPLEMGGKRIRPILCILSCRAVGGRLRDCLHAALAVEILHNFTLVHDDMMDNDDLRRGRPTVHKQWDASTAILAGDGLVTMAFQTLLRTEHPSLVQILGAFTEGLLVLCEGQALDKAFETRESVSMSEYEEMIRKKTSRLIEVSCGIGATLGNADTNEVRALRRFSRSIGTAFQIQDDLLDLISESSVSGKPMGSDLHAKKKTFLTIYFMEHAPSSDVRRFKAIWDQKALSDRDILTIRDLFENSGTFAGTRKAVSGRIDTALNALNALRPGEARTDLEALAVKMKERTA